MLKFAGVVGSEAAKGSEPVCTVWQTYNKVSKTHLDEHDLADKNFSLGTKFWLAWILNAFRLCKSIKWSLKDFVIICMCI